MDANVTAKIIEDVAFGMWSKVKEFFQDIDAHEEIDMRLAYAEYLENTRIQNSKIKTLIYRHVPKDLYSFYECIGVKHGKRIVPTDNVNNLIKISNKLIITGTGGIGKTTLLKHLFLNTVYKTKYVPVLIELRSVNNIDVKEISIHKMIYDNMCTHGFKMKEKHFNYSLEKGGYVIFFDGYDEVNRDKSHKVTSEIKALSSQYGNNRYIISSRPTDSFLGWSDFTEVKSMELTKDQALSLIDKIEFDERVKSRFYNELKDSLFDRYQSFASNPLLLTIMLLTFDNRASIPEKLNDFYEQAFATLFNMHDSTKDEYVRDIRSELGFEDFKLIFSYICFKSYFSVDYEFSESSLCKYINSAKLKFPDIRFQVQHYRDDLVQSVCMLVKDGLNYRFTHRSFQEYFAACYMCKLTDDVQYRLITNWIKETRTGSDSFIPMLFNLQSEKVNKIIFAPGLKTIRNLYKKNGFSLSFVRKIYDSVIIKDGGIGLIIKDSYLSFIMGMSCNLNGYIYNQKNDSKPYIDKLMQVFFDDEDVSYEEILEVISEKEFLILIDWLKQQLEFAMELLEKIEVNPIGNKRKVSSILEEL